MQPQVVFSLDVGSRGGCGRTRKHFSLLLASSTWPLAGVWLGSGEGEALGIVSDDRAKRDGHRPGVGRTWFAWRGVAERHEHRHEFRAGGPPQRTALARNSDGTSPGGSSVSRSVPAGRFDCGPARGPARGAGAPPSGL